MHPDYVYFWYHLNDHSSASTLGILMRIPHNQDMICIFVVFEAQLLAILVAKDLGASRYYYFDKILKISRKIYVYDAKSSISRERDLLSWSTSLREFKTFFNFGGPAGSVAILTDGHAEP